MKALIFDSGSIINFSLNGMLDTLVRLKKEFRGSFIIPDDVEYETVRRPSGIKKYGLSALKVKKLLSDRVLEPATLAGIKETEIEEKTREILSIANHTFFADNKAMYIIDRGEASCLAISEILTRKGIKNVIALDERTTRMLCEKPENLRKLLESKLHTRIEAKRENFQYFSKFRIIRSCELVFIAHKKGLIELENGNVLDALLYAVKYKGCSVSRNEIEQMKKL